MDQKILPLIAVRDLVIFPGSVIPISIKRESSIAALEEALAADKKVFLSMQKNNRFAIWRERSSGIVVAIKR